ncbi:MAG: hypothetical protein DSM107014_03335 [Gomphosphaeria aponina SAG 52.96 = DSM 107014]|uniref:Uncharacterized protein n=1 Tax=Gomphosphaeria aponina SAG 52.96 = DSM 107014 TaxID=1521640 RepID=A0A941JRH4_9CHRO|nr:hypothetical protein [Gomphosphaeria aponina SAG 52.96 = DSM 107014]
MKFNLAISPLNIAKRLTLGVVVLTILSVIFATGNYVFGYNPEWTKMLNLDREMNFPTWYSALMLGFASFLLRAIALGKALEHNRFYPQWKLLAKIFVFLAIDEVLSIHEILIIPDLRKALNLPGIFYSVWVIPGIIVVVIFLKKYWKFTQHLPKRSRFHFMLAAMLYIGGALGMEMVGGLYAHLQGKQNIVYALIANLEEVMEMMGIIVFIYGLLYYMGKWQDNFQLEVKVTGVNSNSQSCLVE